MGKQCIIPTREIQNMAAQLGRNPNVLAADVGLWQEKNGTTAMPTLEQMKVFLVELAGIKSVETAVTQPKVEIYKGYWTRAEVEQATDKVFLFGDNTNDRLNTHYIPSTTQAVIRGLPNVIGIDTKKNRGTNEGTAKTINIYAGTRENADLSNFAERPINFGKITAYSLLEGAKLEAFKSKYPIYSIGEVTYSTKDNPNAGESFVFDGLSDLFKGLRFRTVEGAFQAAKLVFTHPKGNGAKGNRYWQPKKYTQRENSIDGAYYNTADIFVLTEEGKQLLKNFQEASGAQAKSLGKQIVGLDTTAWDANSSKIMKALIGRSFEGNPQALQRLLATGNATLTHTQDKGKWGTEFPKLLMEVREELGGQAPSTSADSSYFTDADFDQFKEQVDKAIQQALDSGKIIVIPKNGIGTGAAQLEKRAPKLFEYLQTKLSELTEQLTEKSTAPKDAGLKITTGSLEELAQSAEAQKASEYTPEEIIFTPGTPHISKEAISESVVRLNMLFTPQ